MSRNGPSIFRRA